MVMDMAKQVSWGELADEEGEDYAYLLPPLQVIGPDHNGVKTVVEHKFNDGNQVKITTTIRVRKLANARLSKRAVERRSWPKFGDAVHEDVGARLTMISTEDIVLERPRVTGSKGEETKANEDTLTQKKGATLMLCRNCNKRGDHWTSRCPYKGQNQPSDTFNEQPTPDTTKAAGATSGTYVRPGLRLGAERTGGSDMRRRDENSVRVSNLSEDTREPDLHELFSTFGPVTRTFVAIDQKTGVSRGFGYVNFLNREDAERAINKLNGYGYDNLILHVEWSQPRAN